MLQIRLYTTAKKNKNPAVYVLMSVPVDVLKSSQLFLVYSFLFHGNYLANKHATADPPPRLFYIANDMVRTNGFHLSVLALRCS